MSNGMKPLGALSSRKKNSPVVRETPPQTNQKPEQVQETVQASVRYSMKASGEGSVPVHKEEVPSAPAPQRKILPMYEEAPEAFLPELPQVEEVPREADFPDVVPQEEASPREEILPEKETFPENPHSDYFFQGESPQGENGDLQGIPAFETLSPGRSPFAAWEEIPLPEENPLPEDASTPTEHVEENSVPLNEQGGTWRRRTAPSQPVEKGLEADFSFPERKDAEDIFQEPLEDAFPDLPEPVTLAPELPTLGEKKHSKRLFLWIPLLLVLLVIFFSLLLGIVLYFHLLPASWEEAVRSFLPGTVSTWPEAVGNQIKEWIQWICGLVSNFAKEGSK